MSARRPWKESRVKLTHATVLTLDGPGDEWLMLCRGLRAPASAPRQTRSPPRRRPRATGHA
jgi:hypothetical protein